MIAPETLLHRLGPYLPTDRFRALLMGQTLPVDSHGAAMFVDISGFTPLTLRLVQEYGPQRASEELKRRLNPMFEAIAGQVFTHGGSVIRFVGDGFTAWFPDTLPHTDQLSQFLPGSIRAAIAGIEMLEMMAFFRDLDLKVAISTGHAKRWVIGNPELGLIDVLTGEVVEQVALVSRRQKRHEVRADAFCRPHLANYPHIHYQEQANGDLLLQRVGGVLVEQSRAHRWTAWQVGGEVQQVLNLVRSFVSPLILEQEAAGLGDLSGELRYATPVFLRFSGLDFHDPAAQQQLNTYVSDIQDILRDTRGWLVSLEVADKGSVIFCVFGAPIAYGDDSQRAVQAALAFRDLPKVHPFIESQSIGISRGLLYSGTVGGEVRHEYTSLGDETNVASRLMSADRKGKILISKAAYDDCSEWFEFAEAQRIQPKGRIGEIPTYTPERAKRNLKRDLRKLRLVGREAEISRFTRLFPAVQGGSPRIWQIEGEAGIGKSRLAAEMLYLAEEAGFQVTVGFCLSAARTELLLPWRDVVRSFFGLQEDWHTQQQVKHLKATVAQQQPQWAARLPLLAELLDLPLPDTPTTRPLSGNTRQQALFSLLIEVLYQEAQKKPLLVILEDIHWMDELTEALLLEIVQQLLMEATPLLLVLLHRPGLDAPALQHLLDESYFTQQLNLNEIPPTAVAELLENRLGGLIPPELVEFVYEKSQGNPFFINEVVDALLDSRCIARIGSRVFIESDLEKTHIPQTVQGLVQARIDNLTEPQKMILKMASVIGRQFETRILFQSLPLAMSGEDFMQHLRTLELRKFSQLESLYPEPIYAFRHAITQEVAYQTLLYAQRQAWHRHVGMVLEAIRPESWERLAYHFARSDDEERALIYLVRAGDKAAQEFANQVALEHWAQALPLARSGKERFDLHCKRLEILLRTANHEVIRYDLSAMIALADEEPQNLSMQLRKLRYQAEYAMLRGEWQEALEDAQGATHLLEQYEEPHLAWEVYSLLEQLYRSQQQLSQQQQVQQKLRSLALELNEPEKALQLALRELQALALEQPEEGVLQLEALYPRITELEDLLLLTEYWHLHSQISFNQRQLSPAEDQFHQLLSLSRQIGNRRMEAHALSSLGQIYYFQGDYSSASTYINNAYKLFRQLNDAPGESRSLVYLGIIALRREAYGEAEAYIRRGMAQQQELGLVELLSESFYFLGQTALMQSLLPEAEQYFSEALQHNTTSLQLQIALAFAQQKLSPSDAAVLLSELEAADLAVLHDPDISFYQLYHLLESWPPQAQRVQQLFVGFVEQQLLYLVEERHSRFLAIGYVRRLWGEGK